MKGGVEEGGRAGMEVGLIETQSTVNNEPRSLARMQTAGTAPPPDDDQPHGPIMGTTLQPEIQEGHGTFAPGSDHATRPFMVTFTTVMSLLHLSPHTVVFLVSEPGPVFLLSLPFVMPNRATIAAVFP